MIETAGPGTSRPAHGAGEPAGGLTAPTAVLVVLVLSVVASVLSAATGRGFGVAFNLIYLLAVVYIALRIHVEDRFTAVVAPPIVYALAVFIGGFFDTETTTHTLRRVIEDTFVNVSLGAPWLVTATIAAIVIVVLRGRQAQRGR